MEVVSEIVNKKGEIIVAEVLIVDNDKDVLEEFTIPKDITN